MSADDRLDEQLHRLIFGPDGAEVDGLDERARAVYRRQVRRSLMGGVRLAIPIARRLAGEHTIDALLSRWLAESPPTTRLYWQLPLEFAAWLREVDGLEHAALVDLVHWETVEVDVLNAPSADDSAAQPGIELDPSARLGIYHYPVFRLDASTSDWPDALDAPAFVLAYRRDEAVYWQVIDPPVAQTLARLAQGADLDEAFAFVAQIYGEIDRDGLTSVIDGLVDVGAVHRR